MRLLLIRHGETDHNAERLALGREDVPLNERGQLQAQALGESLAGASFGDITAVYSSPLQRATATASPLAKALELPVQVETNLIEMEIGEMEGLTFPQLRERYPDFLHDWLSDRLADVTMPGGESLRQVQERGWAAVEAIRDRHPDETVAAVSHNFVILSLLCQVLGLPLARFRSLRHELAAVSVLELDASGNAVVTMNDRCHLRD